MSATTELPDLLRPVALRYEGLIGTDVKVLDQLEQLVADQLPRLADAKRCYIVALG